MPITPSPRNASRLPLILTPESRNEPSARGERGTRGADGRLDLFRRGPARLLADGNRPLEGEHRINIVADQRREPLEHCERELTQVLALAFRVPHGFRHRFVRIAKGNALA